ncbi:MAG TPA: chemotaxis protein CheB [Niastella sp.]
MKAKKEKSKILSANFFPVVGVGASAGGLDAFKRLLRAIPENSGMAYVLVQHLDPSHESLLPEILQKATSIPVLEIANDIKVEPNHIYVIPSNKIMVANDGVLELTTRPEKIKNAKNLPIDIFFTSLAEVHQAHAIGVVLSGTASDGTLGLKAIKDHGGLTFAQDEESAAYEGMPHSAAQAGVVDFILPPEKIPEKLLELTKIINTRHENDQTLPIENEEVFKHIISLLRIRKGTDFTYYKQTTIRRRILRRMALNKNDEPAGYLKYLRVNKAEQDVLYQDLLIPVTSFFRDPKTFENLCETVFPLIVKNKAAGETIRIWVAGCSTGEEAYSIAICIKEFLDDHAITVPAGSVQIFASDISEPAIAKARLGIYTKSELTSLTPHRLKDFFTKSNGGYQVNKQVRDMCVFATHNFLKDPPFSKMDLISCRNVLIYMEPYLQKKALTTFHYALNPKAFLLLGKSETTGGVSDLFAPVAKNDKLFTRKDVTSRHIPVTSQRSEKHLSAMDPVLNTEHKRADFQKTADDIILSKYTPAGVIVNEAMDIVHFRGSTGDYLEPSPGKASFNLLKMVKQGLAFELRNILHKAKKDHAPVIKENIQLIIHDRPQKISIEAVPLPNLIDPHYLILFHNQSLSQPAKTQPSIKRTKDEKDLRIRQLEQELTQTLEDMRSITEDQEAANEELQSANEELLSGSEELQSLNEELETSKEELQSTNEELTVVNQEMINLNEQASAARDYAEAIIINIREPLLVLDKNLRIKTANSSFYKTFQVNETDTEGALIYDVGNKQWNIPALRTLLEKILPEKSILTDYEVTHNFATIGNRTMLLNAREVINNKSPEKLILLSIEDITERFLIRKKIEEQKQELEKAVLKRTYELQQANEALEEKNNELKKINKELESFTYVTSHDLQEPLRKIQTFASKILSKENQHLSDKGKDYFNRMQTAAARMQQLIEDLLAFSRINMEVRNIETTELNTIVEEVKTELAETIEEKHAIIEATELCPANIIPFQFRQLMHNLIGNALKFSKTGIPPHIIIKASSINGSELTTISGISPEKNYCHIIVTDNGIGFDPQYKDQIFEVFQRLHEREEFEGTGIGLAIVKKIVQNHHGIITATSEFGEGATFDIYIPAGLKN